MLSNVTFGVVLAQLGDESIDHTRGVLKGVKVSNSINIMHLLFFDDVLMFGDGTS